MLMKRRQMKLSVDLSPPRFKVENYSWKKEIYSKKFLFPEWKSEKNFPSQSLFFAPLLLLPSFDKVFVALLPSQKAFSSFFQK